MTTTCTTTVEILKRDGVDTRDKEQTIAIENRGWTSHVVLVIDNKRLTVLADDLQRAITNARNHS